MAGKTAFFPTQTYRTRRGIQVHRTVEEIPLQGAIQPLIEALDQRRGVLLTSSYEYPGRYTRWDIGFINPPICLESRARDFQFSALNDRGRSLLPLIAGSLRDLGGMVEFELRDDSLNGAVARPVDRFVEEERSKQPSIFSIMRAVVDLFASSEDRYL